MSGAAGVAVRGRIVDGGGGRSLSHDRSAGELLTGGGVRSRPVRGSIVDGGAIAESRPVRRRIVGGGGGGGCRDRSAGVSLTGGLDRGSHMANLHNALAFREPQQRG